MFGLFENLRGKLMSNTPLPTQLRHDCVNQLDHILTIVGSTELVAVSLIPKVVDEHLASLTIFETLQQMDEISVSWQHWSNFNASDYKASPLLCFNSQGDTYVLSNKKGDEYFLKSFFKPEEEVDSFWLTKENMLKDMGIHPQALSLKHHQKTARFGLRSAPTTPT